MLGRPYMVSFIGQTSGTPAEALIRLSAPADAILEIDEVYSICDTGENISSQTIRFGRASTDGTGTTITPQPLVTGDPAFGGTAIGDITANPTISVDLQYDTRLSHASYFWRATPEERIIIPPSGRFVVELFDSFDTGFDWSTQVSFREIGG